MTDRRHADGRWTAGMILLLVGCLHLAGQQAFGAVDDPYRFEPSQPFRVTTGVVFQEYELGGMRIGMTSVPSSATLPLGERAAAHLRISPIILTGTSDNYFGGFSDAQVSLSYYQPVGKGGVVVSVSANLPTGLRELPIERFETSLLLTQPYFQFQVPILGQGFDVAPSVMWALPLGETIAAGVGVSYQRKGSFRPLALHSETFAPGDEWSIVGGFDVQLTSTITAGGDLIYTHYAADALGGVNVFEAGHQVVGTGQLSGQWGFSRAELMFRYRSRGRAHFPSPGGQRLEAPQMIANHLVVRGSYYTRVRRLLRVHLMAQGRFYDETELFDNMQIFDAGVLPDVAVTRDIRLMGRFMYTLGDITGVQVGGSLEVKLR